MRKQRPLAFALGTTYHGGMAKPSSRASIRALKNLISQVDLILSTTTPLPQNRTPRCRELLNAALALTDDLLNQAAIPPAAVLGHKGGSETAKKYGPDHFRQLAAQRKTRAGGRPRKNG